MGVAEQLIFHYQIKIYVDFGKDIVQKLITLKRMLGPWYLQGLRGLFLYTKGPARGESRA